MSLYSNLALKQLGEIGGDVFLDWGNKLRFFKNRDLRRGLDRCLSDQSRYAPNLKTFIWYCNGEDSGLTQRTAAYKSFNEPKKIGHIADKKIAASQIEKMKLILN